MDERDRLREMLGAYVLGHLSGDELASVEEALANDAQLRQEADELRAVVALLPLVDEDDVATDAGGVPAPDGLADAVLDSLRSDPQAAVTSRAGRPDEVEVAAPRRGRDRPSASAPTGAAGRRPGSRTSRLSPLAVPLAGIALIAAIVGGVILASDSPEPGLGVVEPIEFAVAVEDLQVEASLVPHTWGTEVFLDMIGLIDGEIYVVELETGNGAVSAGTFIGDADLEVVCIMNGAALREDVTAVVVTTQDGTEVMRSALDPVDYRSV